MGNPRLRARSGESLDQWIGGPTDGQEGARQIMVTSSTLDLNGEHSMRCAFIWVMTVSLLLSSPAWAKAKGKSRAKHRSEVVALKFGWPADLTGNVSYRWERTKAGKPPLGTALSAHLVVASEGRNLRVAYRDWKREPADNATAGGPVTNLERMVTIVDRNGALVRVDSKVSADDAFKVASTSPGGARLGADAKKQVAEMIPALTEQATAKTWDMLVGAWAGVELEIGAELESDDEGPVPLVPGATLKTHLRIRAERFLDCPGRPGKRCVELKLRSEPDPESLAKAAESLGAKFGTKGLGAGDMSAVEEFTLVTEPDRLIPHLLDVTRTVGARAASPGGAPPSPQIDHTTWTFDYPPAP
jgi:hypothetical protein